MNEPLLRFLQAARSAGMKISPAESIDAFRAVEVVGYEDRDVLKDTLSLVLAKTVEEKQQFEDCFTLYFSRGGFSGEAESDEPVDAAKREPPPEPAAGEDGEGGLSALSQMLLQEDRAGLAAAMEAAGNNVGLSNIKFFTQANLYARRMMQDMGLERLEQEIQELRRRQTQADTALADRLDRARRRLGEETRDFAQQALALYAKGLNEQLRDEYLQTIRLTNLDRRDLERMRVIVRAIAKRLAARYGRTRRRRRRGQLDARRTIRRNMAWDGVPFVTVWKQRKIEKPRVMVLCDVSGSVAPMAQFLLMFLYALNEALSDIRSFAFAGNLIEVSDILETETTENAIARILHDIGFGSSNYGRSLEDFEEGWMGDLDSKTTVIVLGDARGNNTDPRTDLMRQIFERSKRVIWLNPEYRSSWGTGDSDMFKYAPYCHLVTVCNTVRHLENVVTDLLANTH